MISNKNEYLNCPYSEKDFCKAEGGYWDPKAKQWFVPANTDLEPFRQWWTDSINELAGSN